MPPRMQIISPYANLQAKLDAALPLNDEDGKTAAKVVLEICEVARPLFGEQQLRDIDAAQRLWGGDQPDQERMRLLANEVWARIRRARTERGEGNVAQSSRE